MPRPTLSARIAPLYLLPLFLCACSVTHGVAPGGWSVSEVVLPYGEDGLLVRASSNFLGFDSAVDRDEMEGEPVYNYSADLLAMSGAGGYRLYHGGRFLDSSRDIDGDHVLEWRSATGAAGTWMPTTGEPIVLQGRNTGEGDRWFRNNYLEPEAMRVDGQWLMWIQHQVNPGDGLDQDGLVAEASADRIGLLTSDDGENWVRFKDRGVIVNYDQPTVTNINHHEMIHAPWDDKPFWMYTFHYIDGVPQGHVRIRSDDPTTFDWQQRERAPGLVQIGNQIGYADLPDGSRLFVRVTFITDPDRQDGTIPVLQFSLDGLQWLHQIEYMLRLEGSDHADTFRNCYFLGLATLDGRGPLPRDDDSGEIRTFYAATTAATPVAPEIFHSRIGVGEVRLRVIPLGEDSPKQGIVIK